MILRNHKRQSLLMLQMKIIPEGDTIMCRRHISYLPLANISYAERIFHIDTLCRYFIEKGLLTFGETALFRFQKKF
jgi:hypothetical protein